MKLRFFFKSFQWWIGFQIQRHDYHLAGLPDCPIVAADRVIEIGLIPTLYLEIVLPIPIDYK